MLFSYRLNEAIHDKEELLANNSVRPLSDSDLEELFLPLREKITELKEKIQIKLKFPFNLSKTAEDLALEENYYFSQLKQLVSTDEYEAFYTGITTCTDAHNPEYKFSPINKKIIHKLP